MRHYGVFNNITQIKIKKDRIQFNTLGEEFIMFMVYMVEGVFNGERVIFGKILEY